MEQSLLNRITLDSQVLRGKPTIRGMRISVEQVLKSLAANIPAEELLAEYPELEKEDIHAALLYAATIIAEEKVYRIPA